MEELALILFFLGCLGFFDSSQIVTRIKSLFYFMMAFAVFFGGNAIPGDEGGTSFPMMVLVTGSFFIFVVLGKYLSDTQSINMEDLDDFDD